MGRAGRTARRPRASRRNRPCGDPLDGSTAGTRGHRWRTWYLDPQRKVTKILEPEFAADGRRVRATLSSPEGTLITYTIYHYDRDGHLLELVTHAPDGAVLNTQDA